jgi:hypothetical protein
MNADRFTDALAFAAAAHRGQVRKGTSIPYVSHVLTVCALVQEHGGSEDEAIGALLHDAVEDGGGVTTLAEIGARFGPAVATVVAECSDTTLTPKPPWHERKRAYVAAIPGKSASARRVSLADKVHNARALVADYRACGERLWSRFSAGRDDQLWYYRALVDAFAACEQGPLLDELDAAVTALELEVRRNARAEAAGTPASRPRAIAREISQAFMRGELRVLGRTPTPGWDGMPEATPRPTTASATPTAPDPSTSRTTERSVRPSSSRCRSSTSSAPGQAGTGPSTRASSRPTTRSPATCS